MEAQTTLAARSTRCCLNLQPSSAFREEECGSTEARLARRTPVRSPTCSEQNMYRHDAMRYISTRTCDQEVSLSRNLVVVCLEEVGLLLLRVPQLEGAVILADAVHVRRHLDGVSWERQTRHRFHILRATQYCYKCLKAKQHAHSQARTCRALKEYNTKSCRTANHLFDQFLLSRLMRRWPASNTANSINISCE